MALRPTALAFEPFFALNRASWWKIKHGDNRRGKCNIDSLWGSIVDLSLDRSENTRGKVC